LPQAYPRLRGLDANSLGGWSVRNGDLFFNGFAVYFNGNPVSYGGH